MIATTIEQSKRLMEAGIEPESADFLYTHDLLEWRGEPQLFMLASWQIPAWSLSALWGLASEKGLVLEFNTKEDMADGIVDILVDRLTDPIIKLMDDLKDGKI